MSTEEPSKVLSDSSEVSRLVSEIIGSVSEASPTADETKEPEPSGPVEQEIDYNNRYAILRSTGRHLKAEDELWAICPVRYLHDLCLKNVMDHFLENGIDSIRRNVTDEQWETIMETLPVDLPYELLLPLLDDETYWKRRSISCWGYCNSSRKPWRQFFAERTVEDAIEAYVQNESDVKILDDVINSCKEFVTSIAVDKLQLIGLKGEIEDEEEEEEEDLQVPIPYTIPNHTNIGLILSRFPHLKEFSMFLAPKDCGIDYKYTDYELTNEDGSRLAESLAKLTTLEKFRFSGCHISEEVATHICKSLREVTSLKEVEFSCNVLNSNSCKSVASLLMKTNSIEVLTLSHNAIGEGLKYLAAALTENSTLKSLNVKLNGITDEVGAFFLQCLKYNNVLESLDVSSNLLGEKSGLALAKLIELSSSLKYLNLSGNSMGTVAGRALKEAVEKNENLKVCDVRLCDLGEEAEVSIRKCEVRNSHEKLTWVFENQ